jgi:hypothetical protein
MRQRVTSKPRGAEPADVVGDLPAGGGLVVVVVGAEVGVAHAGVGQQLVVDALLGVPERDAGFGLPRRRASRR